MDHEEGVIRMGQFIVLRPAKFTGLARCYGFEANPLYITKAANRQR